MHYPVAWNVTIVSVFSGNFPTFANKGSPIGTGTRITLSVALI